MPGHGDALARDFRARGSSARLAPPLDRAHGGDVELWARRAGIDSAGLIDFSASINPLGPPPAARKAFRQSYGALSRYPDPYGDRLKAALAERHGFDAAQVLLGNGSTQLIYLLCAALRPRRACIVGPAFSEYANALALAGAEVRWFDLDARDGFRLDSEGVIAAWPSDCDIMFLASPNSFTGRLVARADLEKFAALAAARRTLLVVDEAFVDFIEEASVKALARDNPYLIVLRSLTKFFSLPGLRLGYMLGEPSKIASLAAFQEPWSINAPALSVALACLEDSAFAAHTQRWLARERGFLFRRLAGITWLRAYPADANFLLVRMTGASAEATKLQEFLLRRKILIRTCGFRGLGPEYLRVAVRRRHENRGLVAALGEWAG
jgi:threonine-phosphate decarboxylase